MGFWGVGVSSRYKYTHYNNYKVIDLLLFLTKSNFYPKKLQFNFTNIF